MTQGARQRHWPRLLGYASWLAEELNAEMSIRVI